MTSILRASIALAGLAGSSGALAQLSDFYRPILPPDVSEGGTAGLAPIAGRAYQGADESRTRVLPGLDYQWANAIFAGVGNGVGYNASRRPDMAYGARLTVASSLRAGSGQDRDGVLLDLGVLWSTQWRPQ
ncbi:MAG: MipA/OmpV family protein [Aquabacterium sp.]|jgi:hypothetical protein